MERKKGIIYLCIIVFAMMVVGFPLSAQGDFTPLTDAKKADFAEEYHRLMGNYELVWFDENGGKRDHLVHRYFGTYGDCYVLLRYMKTNMLLEAVDGPYPLLGLTRLVVYPMGCEIYLYNTNRNCKKVEIIHARYYSLYYVQKRGLDWLTDAQLEQLTDDLEAWVAAGNY